jgi:hypothetical protein
VLVYVRVVSESHISRQWIKVIFRPGRHGFETVCILSLRLKYFMKKTRESNASYVRVLSKRKRHRVTSQQERGKLLNTVQDTSSQVKSIQ